MKKCLLIALLHCLSLFPAISFAEEAADVSGLELALPFRDHMVLQRGIDLPVWGTAPAGAPVTVEYDGQRKTTTADKDGAWRVTLDPLKAIKLASPESVPVGKVMTFTVNHNGQTTWVKLNDLVVGDVWLCSGQSNIAGKLKGKGTYQGQVANYPGFRHWTPTDQGGWIVCSPETAGEFKKTAFYFGRDVYCESLIPIGLVTAAVGGSSIESWLNQPPHETGKNYTKLIDPLVGLGIRGMIWYQGESNANKDKPYRPLLTSLIEGWREVWSQGDFPAYYVQLPGYGERTNVLGDKRLGWPALRQDQLETLALKNTGMAITIDIGDKSVHPPNKVDTGKRLARLALYHDYGFDQQFPTGPLYKSHRIKGPAVHIEFVYADKLMLAEKQGISPPTPSPDKSLLCLSLMGEDGVWHTAEGKIEGGRLIITSQAVPKPVAARYAYSPHPAGPLLYNKDGLPASPFTTERKLAVTKPTETD
ncbi:MAG: sialate O-acetylesterase [Phycisphaeraceae bacterium]